jgi:uncharacterized protein YggE
MNVSDRGTVLVALLLLVAGCLAGFASASAVVDDESASDASGGDRTIEVAATGAAEAEPNRVMVRVTVMETAETAARARRQLAENSSRLREALDSVDVADENVTTVRYDIRYDRDPDVGADGPYRAVQEFLVTTPTSDRAGRVIDAAAVRGGAQIDGVRFGFSRGRYRTLKERALQDAMGAAREQASATAETEGLRLTGVSQVRTAGASASGGLDARSYATSGASGGVPTDLAGGPRTVQVGVVVAYNVSR